MAANAARTDAIFKAWKLDPAGEVPVYYLMSAEEAIVAPPSPHDPRRTFIDDPRWISPRATTRGPRAGIITEARRSSRRVGPVRGSPAPRPLRGSQLISRGQCSFAR